MREGRLTNKILLASANLESDKSHNGSADGQSSKHESRSDTLGGLKNTLDQQDEREGVDYKVNQSLVKRNMQEGMSTYQQDNKPS